MKKTCIKQVLSIALFLALTTATPGCESMFKNYGANADTARVDLKPSRTTCYAGENVTFMTRTENSMGHKSELKWTTTGGKLTVDDNGRTSRVMFEQIGTYSVDVTLMLDGVERSKDTKVIEVVAIP